MVIYTNYDVFGIRIYSYTNENICYTLFEQKYDAIITYEQSKEAYLFYKGLKDKSKIFFKVYTECSSPYYNHNKGKFMMWYPMSLNLFLEKVGLHIDIPCNDISYPIHIHLKKI